MDDVRYLPPIYADLKAQLQERGRLEWAQFEFERAQQKATRPEDDENAYQRLNLSKLKRKQLAVGARVGGGAAEVGPRKQQAAELYRARFGLTSDGAPTARQRRRFARDSRHARRARKNRQHIIGCD